MIDKTFIIKIYDSSGVFIKTLPPGILANTPSFNAEINGGYGECRLELNLPFEDFGEGEEIDFMNIVKIYVIDALNPKGRVLYTGFISAYEPYIDGGKQGVTVILLGMISLLSWAYYKNGTNFTVVHTSQDTSIIMKAIIDHFRSVYGTGYISYDGVDITIDTVGNTASYTFSKNTWIKALTDIFGTIGVAGWYWHLGRDGRLYLKQKPSTATHKFTVGQVLVKLRALKNSEKIINAVTIEYGASTYSTEDATSISRYKRRELPISDNKVTNLATATLKGAQIISTNKDHKISTSVTVNNSYDLESIKVGETCTIQNLKMGSTTLIDNMQIMSIQYAVDSMTLQLEEINNNFGKELNSLFTS